MALVKSRDGGGRDSVVPGVGFVLEAVDLVSSKSMARQWPSAATGPCLHQPIGVGGDFRRGCPYGGGVDPSLVTDVGLHQPWSVHNEAGGRLCLVARMPERRPWKVVRMFGSPTGAMSAVVALSLGRVGGKRQSSR
ncbi:TOM1-like protein 2 [Hordeum vulgare]|nr:TOM1-like protein 2 [Hordeum vulgare]